MVWCSAHFIGSFLTEVGNLVHWGAVNQLGAENPIGCQLVNDLWNIELWHVPYQLSTPQQDQTKKASIGQITINFNH